MKARGARSMLWSTSHNGCRTRTPLGYTQVCDGPIRSLATTFRIRTVGEPSALRVTAFPWPPVDQLRYNFVEFRFADESIDGMWREYRIDWSSVHDEQASVLNMTANRLEPVLQSDIAIVDNPTGLWGLCFSMASGGSEDDWYDVSINS